MPVECWAVCRQVDRLICTCDQVDVAEEAQVKALVSRAQEWGGRLDIYVNSHVRWIFGGVDTVSDAGV